MSGPKFPKPEQFRLSPETQRGLAEFKRAMIEAGEQMAQRYAQACRDLNASLEQARQQTHESPAQPEG